MLLAIECRLNRLSGILERIGAGLAPAASSPSLEGCALFDAWHIAKTTNDVPRLLDTASSDNPWGKPGTVLASRAVSGMCVPASRVLSRRLTVVTTARLYLSGETLRGDYARSVWAVCR